MQSPRPWARPSRLTSCPPAWASPRSPALRAHGGAGEPGGQGFTSNGVEVTALHNYMLNDGHPEVLAVMKDDFSTTDRRSREPRLLEGALCRSTVRTTRLAAVLG